MRRATRPPPTKLPGPQGNRAQPRTAPTSGTDSRCSRNPGESITRLCRAGRSRDASAHMAPCVAMSCVEERGTRLGGGGARGGGLQTVSTVQGSLHSVCEVA